MYNSSCDSYIASTLNQSSFDHWPLAYPTQPEVPNPYIPVPSALEDLRSQNKVWSPVQSSVHSLSSGVHSLQGGVHSLEYKKGSTGSYRNTRSTSRSRSATAGIKKPAQVKKLRKSENQIEVLKNYFKTNAKPGRENVAQLAAATGLKFLEVRNWFRNARLRNKEGVNQQGLGMKSEDDSCGEVSSSTGNMIPVDKVHEISMLWDKLDNEDRKSLLPKYLSSWEKDSPERTEVIKTLLKCLSTTERNFVHGAVKPRGPYRCSSDKNLSKTTILERAKNAWKELERMFGANKQKNPTEGCSDNNLSLNLDRDMLEGLKSLFQAHRDYLYYLVKEMGIDTSDEKDMGKLKSASSLQRYSSTTEDDMFIPHPQYGSVSPATMDMLQPYTHNVAALGNGYPTSVYPIMPATPTPIYPTGPSDFMSYPYTHSQHSYPQPSPLQLGSSSASTAARSAWVPTLSPTEERSPTLTKSYYPDSGPDYSFVKNHFSPEKLSAHQPDKAPLIKPFSEVGGMSFNYNTTGPNTEITQKCTFVKYYEVTYNNKTCPTTGAQISPAGKPLPVQPLQALTAPPVSSSKFEQLL
ncbi:hypothetical protein ACHWQZ_G005077 [Mnemiopsis leidyi]